jgi:hypothetical protein
MGNTVHGAWGATLHEYLKMRATFLVYWELLRDSADRGFHYYDMGRSPAGTGSSAFKGQWGGVSRPIYQQVAHVGAVHHGDSVTDRLHSNARFRLLMKAWPRLPVPVVRFLGPKLRRHVPFA